MVWEVGDSGSGRVRVRHRSMLVSVGQPYAFGGHSTLLYQHGSTPKSLTKLVIGCPCLNTHRLPVIALLAQNEFPRAFVPDHPSPPSSVHNNNK
jgi:hypothetical protein